MTGPEAEKVLNDFITNKITYEDKFIEAINHALSLYAAIRKHRDQKADDRCIEDDDRLYEALGDGIKCDRRVGSKDEMLSNCKRFIENRCESGHWPSYIELEKRIKDLESKE